MPLEGPLVRTGQGVEAGDLSQPARPAEPVYYDGSLLGSGGKRPSGAAGLLVHGYSTEELSQEMANLEGLMKDLSAITASQFNC